jgi:signal transduction histidine kinase
LDDKSTPFSEIIQRLKLISEIKSGLKQYDSAFHYLLKYTTLHDSLAGSTTAKHVADLEMKYQTALKDKSIAQQLLQIRETEDKIRKRNNWLLVALSSLLVVTAISVASYISYRSKKKLLSQQILTLQKEKELESVKAAMEAREQERQRIGKEMHDDLGAGLTSILYQANSLRTAGEKISHLPQIDKINDTATALISQMRDIVWAMNNEYDTVDDLVAYIRHQTGTLLSQSDIEYEINTPENIPSLVIRGEQRRNVYLVTKEAVHNIIKHAGASFVAMTIEVNGELSVTITDNGRGIDEIVRELLSNSL